MESFRKVFSGMYHRYFSNVEAIILFFFLITLLIVFEYFGDILKPLFASILIAYLLGGLVNMLQRVHVPHFLAVFMVYCLFLSLILFVLFGIFPPLWQQAFSIFNEVPNLLTKLQSSLSELQEKYPDHISSQQIMELTGLFRNLIAILGQKVLSFSISTISNIVSIILYCVIVPLLVYFILLDKEIILNWCNTFLPTRRTLFKSIWHEIDEQIGKYIRGRVLEILIVSVATYIAFGLYGLQYAMLLAVLSGVSVIIPYIGAIVVTFPVVLIAYMQFGWSVDLAYISLIYAIITVISGYVLEPILFSEALNLHPIAIIVAIMIFGGIWGFWGVFFAIPLATVVRAIINAWPREEMDIS